MPPALTPFPLSRLPLPERRSVRDVPQGLEPQFERLRELGLPGDQVTALREDYRAEDVSEVQLSALETTLIRLAEEDTIDGFEPRPPEDDQALDSPAVLVYRRAAEGSRTRELLTVLAESEGGLTPEEIGLLMRPRSDGTRVEKSSYGRRCATFAGSRKGSARVERSFAER